MGRLPEVVHIAPLAGDSGLSRPNPRRDSLQMLRAALDAVPDAVLILNPNGTIQLANLQVQHVFGWRPDDLEGLPVETLVPDMTGGDHLRRRVDDDRRTTGLLLLSAEHKSGSLFPAEISLASITLVDGEPLWTVATVRDITGRLELEREAEEFRNDVLANITHELRTPLSSIVGYTELMSDLPPEDLSSRARGMLEVVSRNAQRELALVSDVLTVALSGAGRLTIAHNTVDLVALAGEAVSEHTTKAARVGVALRLQEPEEMLPCAADAVGDQGRLRQVLDNLIANALKFTEAGGQVVVGCFAADGHLCVSVSDTGPGIADDERSRVFERLFRGRAAIRGEVEGAGLGLAICRAIVEAHHGRITVDSTPGQGSVFTIAFPVP